jgi:V/A-type H+-transporting ATPase subunit A
MLKVILAFYDKSLVALQEDAPFSKLVKMPVREKIGRLKYVPEEDVQAQYDAIMQDLNDQIRALTEGGEQHA